jgi:hypothetical protein
MMDIETLDRLDDKMQELDAFKVPLLAEAIAESDRSLMLIRILMMCDEKQLPAARKQFNQCIADYFGISDLDDAKSVYDREGLSDFRRDEAA